MGYGDNLKILAIEILKSAIYKISIANILKIVKDFEKALRFSWTMAHL